MTEGFIGVNIETPDFHRADGNLRALIDELRPWSGDRNIGQIMAELTAGRWYIQAPKARRDIIDELLVKPLRQLDGQAPSERIRATASAHLNWLLQIL